MRIAVASGKGGAGKTTIATSLAVIAAERGLTTTFLDCDVEEPNGHLFLHPALCQKQVVNVPVPQLDEKTCRDHGVCGRCGQACHFSAIVCLGDVVVVNPDLCHGCGACILACPANALKEVPHRTGVVESGQAGALRFAQGLLDVGQAMASPVIRRVKEWGAQEVPAGLTIVDAPPGTACPTVEAVRGSDFVLLVVEATPFGLHDAALAADTLEALGVRAAAVLNRVDRFVEAGRGITEFGGAILRGTMPVLARIPADRQVAEAYARGQMPIGVVPRFRQAMERLLTRLLEVARREAA